MYKVKNPNPYCDDKESQKVMQIKILEILYNEEICNLIYMQDISSVYQ